MATHEPGPRELWLGTLAVAGLALLGNALSSAATGQLCTIGGGCLTAAEQPGAFWTTITMLVVLTSAVVGGAWLGSRRLGMPLLPPRERAPTPATATPAPPRLRVARRSSGSRR
jgi:hypothetical protein